MQSSVRIFCGYTFSCFISCSARPWRLKVLVSIDIGKDAGRAQKNVLNWYCRGDTKGIPCSSEGDIQRHWSEKHRFFAPAQNIGKNCTEQTLSFVHENDWDCFNGAKPPRVRIWGWVVSRPPGTGQPVGRPIIRAETSSNAYPVNVMVCRLHGCSARSTRRTLPVCNMLQSNRQACAIERCLCDSPIRCLYPWFIATDTHHAAVDPTDGPQVLRRFPALLEEGRRAEDGGSGSAALRPGLRYKDNGLRAG